VETDTAEVAIENPAEVAPDAIRTVAGTGATVGFELVNATSAPAGGAGPLMYTLLAVVTVPSPTVVGERLSEETAVGMTVTAADCVTPPKEAERLTGAEVVTQVVVIVNVVEVAPATTVTLSATVARAGFELERVTTAPSAGAGPFRYTLFEVDVLPPTIVVGFGFNDATAVGFTVSVPVWMTPSKVAVMVTTVELVTNCVVIVKFTTLCPAGTVTVAGTEAAGPELESATTAPPVSAGPLR